MFEDLSRQNITLLDVVEMQSRYEGTSGGTKISETISARKTPCIIVSATLEYDTFDNPYNEEVALSYMNTCFRSLFDALESKGTSVLNAPDSFISSLKLYLVSPVNQKIKDVISAYNWNTLGLAEVNMIESESVSGGKSAFIIGGDRALVRDECDVALMMSPDIFFHPAAVDAFYWIYENFSSDFSEFLTYGLYRPLEKPEIFTERRNIWGFYGTSGGFYGKCWVTSLFGWNVSRSEVNIAIMGDAVASAKSVDTVIKEYSNAIRLPNLVPVFTFTSIITSREGVSEWYDSVVPARTHVITHNNNDSILYRKRFAVTHKEAIPLEFAEIYKGLKISHGSSLGKLVLQNHQLL